MNEMDIAYLLLQNEYFEKNGLANLSELELLQKETEIFPEGWLTVFSVEKRVELLSLAIKNNISLFDAENSIKNR